MKLPRLLCLPAVALILFADSSNADWPQWRGPDRTGLVPKSVKVPKNLAAAPKLLWKIPVGHGFSSPVADSSKVYIFDNQGEMETLRAVEISSGKEIWRVIVDTTFKDSQGPPGPRATPVIDGKYIYVTSCRGELQCLETKDGKKIWSANFEKDFGVPFIGEKGNVPGARRHGNTSAPLVDGKNLFVFVGSTNNAAGVLLDKRTGKKIWTGGSDEAGYAPVLSAKFGGRDQYILFGANGLFGLDRKNGDLLWQSPLSTAYGRHAATPVIYKETVIFSSHQTGLRSVKIEKKDGQWKAVELWTSKPAAMNFASPLLIGKHVYGLGPTKNIICVDAENGAVVWSQDGYIHTSADKAYAGFIGLGSNIFMLNDTGEGILFEASPERFKEVSRAQFSGKNWCVPAYSDGKLFLRDAKEFFCFQLLE